MRGGDTAFTQRDAAHDVNINAVWLPATEAGAARPVGTRAFDALGPGPVGAYVNFLATRAQERVRAASGPERTRAWPRSSAATTPTTCSGSTRTSGRRDPDHEARPAAVERLLEP